MVPSILAPLGSLRDLELTILHAVNCEGESPLADTIAAFANDPLFGIPVFLLFFLVVAASRQGRARLGRLVLAAVLGLGMGQVAVQVVWRVAPRERPGKTFTEEQILRTPNRRLTCAEHPEMWVERGHPPKVPSFPSSHVMTAGAVAMVLCFGSAWVGGIAWAYALLVGFGRLYWGKHWPSDVLGSLLLASLAGWLAWRLAGKLVPRLRRRPPVTAAPPEPFPTSPEPEVGAR